MVAALVAVLASALAGCGSGTVGGGGNNSGGASSCPADTTQTGSGGGGATLTIGQKGFSEEKVLASIAKVVLEKHGYSVKVGVTAADPAIGQALTNNSIDMLWQYTGTELQSTLGEDSPPKDLTAAFKDVQQKDAAKGLCWVAPTAFTDTNALAIRTADGAKFGTSISSLTAYMKDHKDVKICVASQFLTRTDGVVGLEAAYGSWKNYPGLQVDEKNAEGDVGKGSCDVGQVYTTDPNIASNNLTVLTDDKKFLPPDNAGLIVRAPVLNAHPDIGALLAPVAAKLTTAEITKLNGKADAGTSADQVAEEWLTQNGLI